MLKLKLLEMFILSNIVLTCQEFELGQLGNHSKTLLRFEVGFKFPLQDLKAYLFLIIYMDCMKVFQQMHFLDYEAFKKIFGGRY